MNKRQMELQGIEYEALKELIRCYHNLPPVLDNRYPGCRVRYECALESFMDAVRNNGREVE